MEAKLWLMDSNWMQMHKTALYTLGIEFAEIWKDEVDFVNWTTDWLLMTVIAIFIFKLFFFNMLRWILNQWYGWKIKTWHCIFECISKVNNLAKYLKQHSSKISKSGNCLISYQVRRSGTQVIKRNIKVFLKTRKKKKKNCVTIIFMLRLLQIFFSSLCRL